MIFADLELARKLESTDANANRDMVETRRRLFPDSDAEWIEVGGAYAMFDGVESPLTQTFGLGIFQEAAGSHLDEIEAFFEKHNAPVLHEVSPLAGAEVAHLLSARGYSPVEFTSVMFRPIAEIEPYDGPENIKTHVADGTEFELWAETSAAGWASEAAELGEFMLNFGRISARCRGAYPYLAEVDGETAAAGMLFIYNDICNLAGASTIPSARRRGAQNALLHARLAHARDQGCTLAMMCALPGSQSQRNAEKNGFSVAYTRVKWQLNR